MHFLLLIIIVGLVVIFINTNAIFFKNMFYIIILLSTCFVEIRGGDIGKALDLRSDNLCRSTKLFFCLKVIYFKKMFLTINFPILRSNSDVALLHSPPGEWVCF